MTDREENTMIAPMTTAELARLVAECREHTPGPWEARERIVLAGPRSICILGYGWERTDEDAANLRLIAVAPRLLAAVEQLGLPIAPAAPSDPPEVCGVCGGRHEVEDDVRDSGGEPVRCGSLAYGMEPVEVHPAGTGAELARLRAMEERLRDERLAMTSLWGVRGPDAGPWALAIIEQYRAAVLREPTP